MRIVDPKFVFCLSFILFYIMISTPSPASEAQEKKSIFAKDNLMAWCIVPFDAKNRTPRERAEMLQRLGLKRMAYDWRDKNVPTFEEEIVEMKKHGIEFFAFWSWHPAMVSLIKKHGISPQFWIMPPEIDADTYEHKVEVVGKALLPLVECTRKLDCRIGLYNHGGWGGEPKNLVALVKWLRVNTNAEHVGIVYNFHHGHGHIKDFTESFIMMKPYLLCVNLNGMNDNENPLILPIGSGQHELEMMKVIIDSSYQGPIGILDHRSDMDAEESLRQNIKGINKLLYKLGEEDALEH